MTTTQASKILNVTRYRVWALIKSGRLSATWDEASRSWNVSDEDLAAFKKQSPGRPKKV